MSLALAHLLRATYRPLRPVLSFLLLLPGLTPPVVLGILFLLVFHGEVGLINRFLLAPLGIETVRWLIDPRYILPALLMAPAASTVVLEGGTHNGMSPSFDFLDLCFVPAGFPDGYSS